MRIPLNERRETDGESLAFWLDLCNRSEPCEVSLLAALSEQARQVLRSTSPNTGQEAKTSSVRLANLQVKMVAKQDLILGALPARLRKAARRDAQAKAEAGSGGLGLSRIALFALATSAPKCVKKGGGNSRTRHERGSVRGSEWLYSEGPSTELRVKLLTEEEAPNIVSTPDSQIAS